MGTSMMDAARRKDEATQLKARAFMEKSPAIIGRATLTDEPMKGVVKELMVVARRTMGRFLLRVMRSRQMKGRYVREKLFYATRQSRLCRRPSSKSAA